MNSPDEAFTYAEDWHDELRFVRDPISLDEARHRFVHGPQFVVVPGTGWLDDFDRAEDAQREGRVLPVAPYALYVNPLADASADLDDTRTTLYIEANFFDLHTGSLRMVYGWKRLVDRMFLKSVVAYTYPDDERYHVCFECTEAVTLDFDPAGTSRETIDRTSRPTLDVIDRADVDLSANVEPVPEFGDWARFGVLDRKR